MQDRVYTYIEHEGRVAVFMQPHSPQGGMQVPGGGVESDESLEDAAVRETLEETGLACEVVGYLGSTTRQGWFPDAGSVDIERHYFHLRPLVEVEETWTWFERDASDGSGPIEFHFRWLPAAAPTRSITGSGSSSGGSTSRLPRQRPPRRRRRGWWATGTTDCTTPTSSGALPSVTTSGIS